ncbi:MAG: hypothetical protein ABIN18_08865, partial [Pseudomonadota bacterium]
LLDRMLFTFLILSFTGTLQPPAGKIFRRTMIKLISALLVRRLRVEVQRFSPDVIVATQMHPAALLSGINRWRSARQGTVAVITDYGVHDLWVQPRTDHYCVPTEDVAEDLRRRDVPAPRETHRFPGGGFSRGAKGRSSSIALSPAPVCLCWGRRILEDKANKTPRVLADAAAAHEALW